MADRLLPLETLFVMLVVVTLGLIFAAHAAPRDRMTTIDVGVRYQTIDGFGTGVGDSDPTVITDNLADLLWDPEKGIGLSIFRMQIDQKGQPSTDPDDFKRAGGWDVWGHVHKAMLRDPQLRVIASPMSPPGVWKDNLNVNNGGALCAAAGQRSCTTGHYLDWASVIASFVATAAAQNPPIPVYAISVQNEPDFAAFYASCLYTPAQMCQFVRVLGPKLSSLRPRPALMAPEAANWSKLGSYVAALEADETARHYVDIYAVHQYGYGQPRRAPTTQSSRPLWQTEMSGLAGGPEARWDPSIDNAIAVAGWIHDAIVMGNVSAWLWWRAVNEAGTGSPPAVTDNQDLLIGRADRLPADTTITKRVYGLGNYSKFVRPGSVRVGVSGRIPDGVSLSAYFTPLQQVVAVAINRNRGPVRLPLRIYGQVSPHRFSPWVTSARYNLERQPSISVIRGRADCLLAARSITTLVSE